MKTDQVLTVMKIFAWIAFFGYSIQCGSYLISYIVSWFNPQAASDIYKGLDLFGMKEHSNVKYTIFVASLVAVAGLKANIWYRVTQIIPKIKIENPFTIEVARRLEKISLILLIIWILGYAGSAYAGWLSRTFEFVVNSETLRSLNSGEFLFMAGLLFIVSQIYKRGVELQSENELTV